MTRAAELAARLPRIARALVPLEFAVAVAFILYAGAHDVAAVFLGAPDGVPARVTATCESAQPEASCGVSVVELRSGRFRVASTGVARMLTVELTAPAGSGTRQLLVRPAQPEQVQLLIPSQATEDAAVSTNLNAGIRTVVPLAASPLTAVRLTAPPDAKSAIVVDEIGLFDRSAGLLTDERPLFKHIPPLRYHGTLVLRALAALCLFSIVAATFVPAAVLRPLLPVLLALVAFALAVVDLATLYSPYWGQDLRVFYSGGPVLDPPGSNLNTGLWQGFRLLHGSGLTLRDGLVPWERMPGYGIFVALAGLLFGHGSLLNLAISTVVLQTIFYSLAVAVFAWAASNVMPAAAAWALGVLLAWLPKELGLTQVDAIIAPVAMLVLASLCFRMHRASRDGDVSWPVDVLVHSAFASWFILRPDVVPGWFAMSLFLHRRRWRRLLIPVAFFLAIGCAWGAYKARYSGEFTLTTSSAGASLWCGLWEVPSRFALKCSDPDYFAWIEQHTPYKPQSSAANGFATREVVRFWLTYPGHLALMLNHKMMQMIDGDLWPGYPTQLQVFVFGAIRRYWLVVPLLAVIALSLVLGHQRERTLVLAWPLLFDAPLFWLMFASLGRFYSAVGVALLAAAIPPLFERPFYAAIAARPARAASVLACAAVLALAAWPLHDWLLRADALHYWTPLLDPAGSRLAGLE